MRDASLRQIVDLMERHGVKRIPIVENGHVIGVVSRASMVQALASGIADIPVQNADETLRIDCLRIEYEAVGTRLWSM